MSQRGMDYFMLNMWHNIIKTGKEKQNTVHKIVRNKLN